MTDTSREAVERLLDGVTPGPWRVRVNKRDSHDECDLSICGDIFVLADLNGPQYPHQHPNARFIAAARDLVPALLARAEALRADLTAALQRELMQMQRADEAEAKVAKAVDALGLMDKAAGEVARMGAVTGPQWTRLTVALLKGRATIAEINGESHD